MSICFAVRRGFARLCVIAIARALPAASVPLLVALANALALTGCTEQHTAVVVGGKNFTEQRILGELLAQAIENAGLPVERRLDLGGTFVCDGAIRAGQIDVYVEYTGTALGAILKTQAPAGNDATRVPDASEALSSVRDAYGPAGLVWTAPLGFDNTFALVVRSDAPAQKISDIAAHGGKSPDAWRAAFGYEFEQRADGYPALQRAYGLSFADIRTMDLGLLYRALIDRQADVVVGSATDAAIARFSLRMLDDDRRAFAPYEAVPVVRRAALQRHRGLEAALTALGGKIDLTTMRRMNEAVEGQGRTPAEVVREFLASPATQGAPATRRP